MSPNFLFYPLFNNYSFFLDFIFSGKKCIVYLLEEAFENILVTDAPGNWGEKLFLESKIASTQILFLSSFLRRNFLSNYILSYIFENWIFTTHHILNQTGQTHRSQTLHLLTPPLYTVGGFVKSNIFILVVQSIGPVRKNRQQLLNPL